MDKISKLLEETQNLLEGFSSGTLSPVSSYYNSDEETEFEENFNDLELRKVLNGEEGYKIIKFIENNFKNSTLSRKALHICVEERCKDLEVFKTLLRSGCDPLELDSEGRTALTLLLEQKEEDSQGALEVEEMNCLISTLLGEWELRRAATKDVKIFKFIHERNWKDFFKFLKEQNSLKFLYKPDAKYAGISPLHEIAAMNDVGCLRKILSKYKDIDLNIKSIGTGNTLLHEASHMSSTEMVQFLIESGARCDVKNASGRVAAHLGTEQIQVIFEFKNLSRSSSDGSEREREQGEKNFGVKNSESINVKGVNKDSVQIDNSLYSHKDTSMSSRKDTSLSSRKDTSLKRSSSAKELSSKKTAELFVQAASASTDSLSREERKMKQIIGFLDKIERHKISEVDEEEDGRSENDTDDITDDNTDADTDTDTEKITQKISDKISDNFAILQRENHTGRTILHRYARRNQSEKLLQFIRQYEVECREQKLFEVIDNSGWTPLHDAASEGSLEAVKIFLFAGKDGKTKNLRMNPSIPAAITGDTPLHAAALAGNLEIVELLLEVGADGDAVNIEGKRPVDVTRSKAVRKLLSLRSENQEGDTVQEQKYRDSVKEKEEPLSYNNTASNEEPTSFTIPVKRGPGRPRKYPRPDQENVSNKHPSPPKQAKQTNTAKPVQSFPLPLTEILPNGINCIVLVKFQSEWLMSSQHFLPILAHFLKGQGQPQVDLESKISPLLKSLSEAERASIYKLPSAGNLIQVLQKTAAEGLIYISKTAAVRILETQFNYNLNGPFGYINVPKVLEKANDHFDSIGKVVYSGCPIKLKLKMNKFNNSSNTYNNNIAYSSNNNNASYTYSNSNLWISSSHEEQKSPKTFSM